MSVFDSQAVEPEKFEKDQNVGQITNVKKLTIDGGDVRIEHGALIVSDETGLDRVLIGYLKDGF